MWKDIQHHWTVQKCIPTHIYVWIYIYIIHTHTYSYVCITTAGEDVEKLEPLCTADGNVNGTDAVENDMAVSSKTKYKII